MKKTFPIILLSNDNSELTIKRRKKLGLLYKQYLYIISDDEIKEDDWFIDTDNTVCQAKTPMFAKIANDKKCKKIVATTDKSLRIGKCDGCFNTKYNPEHIIDGYHYYAGEKSIKCTSICLPQIPESFIQAYIKSYNEGKPITEVDLEYEELNYIKNGGDSYKLVNEKEAQQRFRELGFGEGKIIEQLKTREDNTVIVHQSNVHQSKMYSLDEVEDLLNKVHKNGSEWGLNHSYASSGLRYPTEESRIKKLNKWIQDNLK